MPLKPGSPAPDFTLHSLTPTEADISLSSYKGKKNVVLLFFPQSFTGVCKDELCTVSKPEEFKGFENKETVILGISVDGTFPQKAFAEQNMITVPLLSDFNKEVVKKYGVLRDKFVHGMNGVANRSVFVIDKNGILKYVEVTENPGVQINFDALKKAVSALN
jgi:glutaredoxin-dependent peroxiredoxin